jgi:hypothetical protein
VKRYYCDICKREMPETVYIKEGNPNIRFSVGPWKVVCRHITISKQSDTNVEKPNVFDVDICSACIAAAIAKEVRYV